MSRTNDSHPRLEAKDYWPHFEESGALDTWVIDSGGDVELARSPALKLRQGLYLCIQNSGVIGEQHEQGLSSFFQAMGSNDHIDAADAVGSLKYDAWRLAKLGVAIDYVRNAQSKARNQRKNLSQIRSYTYQYPKKKVKLRTAALELTPECRARLEELRRSLDNSVLWKLFHEEFGLFVCPIMTFGGAIYTDRILERASEEESDQREDGKHTSEEGLFQTPSLIFKSGVNITAHSKEDQSRSSSSITQTATKAGVWRKIGGKNPNSNFQEWIEELGHLTAWGIIRAI